MALRSVPCVTRRMWFLATAVIVGLNAPLVCHCSIIDKTKYDRQLLEEKDDDEFRHLGEEGDGFDDEDTMIPSIMDRQDVSYFYEVGLEEFSETIQFVFERSSRMPRDEEDDMDYFEETGVMPPPQHHELPQRLTERGSGFAYSTRAKIRHDLEQARYLASILPDETEGSFFKDLAVPIYQGVLDNMMEAASSKQSNENDGEHDFYAFTANDYEELNVDLVYNKAWRPTFVPALTDDKGKLKRVLKKGPKAESLQKSWKDGKGVVVLDGVLSEAALTAMQQIIAESTIWFEAGITSINGGDYVAAASLDDGLQDKLLLQLVYELEESILQPMVGGTRNDKSDLVLHDLWARKYDTTDSDGQKERIKFLMPGDLQSDIRVHIWLTNTTTSTDDQGLTIYSAEPPSDYDPTSETAMEDVVNDVLEPSDFANTTVRQKFNRAVIYNARLFHTRHQDDDDDDDASTTAKDGRTTTTSTPYPDKYSTELTLLYGPKLKQDDELEEEEENDEL